MRLPALILALLAVAPSAYADTPWYAANLPGTLPAGAVIVAVIDTGLAPGSALRRWTNPEEDRDGRDDDRNGYVDDVEGWNFADGSAALDDVTGHGTSIAGVVNAVAPEVTIMVLKVANTPTGTNTDEAARAVVYAVEHGAAVVNMSFTTSSANPALEAAVAYAARKGVLLVAAAGNDAGAARSYPASFDAVVSVGAHGADGSVAPFSGIAPDILAPGVGLPIDGAEVTGTSFAAAYVSGLAARLKAARPDLSASRFEALLQSTAADARHGLTERNGTGAVDPVRIAAALLDIPAPSSRVPSTGGTISRGAFLTMLLSARGIDTRDVSVSRNMVFDSFSTPYVRVTARAKELGLIEGRAFRPKERITRFEAYRLVTRLVRVGGANILVPAGRDATEAAAALGEAFLLGIADPMADREVYDTLPSSEARAMLSKITTEP